MWCRNIKPKDYRGISTSFTTVNKFLIWNRIFDAVFCVFFQLLIFMRKHSFSTKPSKTQHTHWIWIEFKHLLVYPNQQVDRHCEINSLVYKTPFLGINHTLYWLVTVLLWFKTWNRYITEVYKPSSQRLTTFWDKTGFLIPPFLSIFQLLVF